MTEAAQDRPVVKCFKDLKLTKVDWLWPNKFPLGKLALVVGDQDLGKSMFTLYMAAQVSTGRPWIDSPKSGTPGDVIILTVEDTLDDVVGPRLLAAGADMSRVHYIDCIKASGKQDRPLFNLTKDFPMLVRAVQDYPNTKFVIIDPISGYMWGKNENKNAEVREYLNPLAALAKHANLSIVGISHLNKNQLTQMATYRVLGSVAFTATVRAVWLVGIDPEDETCRLFLPHKANLSNNPTGLSFTIMSEQIQIGEEKGKPIMDNPPFIALSPEPIHLTARDYLAPKQEKRGRPSKQDPAQEWLESLLSEGPVDSNLIFSEGDAQGFSKSLLNKLAKKIKIECLAIQQAGTGKILGSKWQLKSDVKDTAI